MLEATNINWTNCWRVTIILLGLAMFFAFTGETSIAKFFGYTGGISFIIMLVIRYEDFAAFMDGKKK